MKTDSGSTESLWMRTARAPQGKPLQEDLHAEVCIVGAGITGLTTAYLLACEGKSVVVLDDGDIGGGETSRTTGHLATGLDDRYHRLEKYHGEGGARLAAESHAHAIDRVEQICRSENIDCDFRRVDGYLFVPPGESEHELFREMEAAQRAGLSDVELLTRLPVDAYDFGPALRFPRQARFHALRYLQGLAACVIERGGRIHTRSFVERIEDGEPVRISVAGGHTVTATDVVVATNSPVNNLFTPHTKQAAYRSYVIALRIPAGWLPDLLAWDTPDPYHYLRKARSEDPEWDLLIVGGEDHKTGQSDGQGEAPFQRLEQWTRERFPMAAELVAAWSGQVMEPVDGLAYIGRNPHDEHIYVATGDSGNGLTHGTIAGLLITDLIQGRENPWTRLYDPGRVPLRAAAEFARENLNVAAQYADLFASGELSGSEELQPGQGAILRRGLHQIAAYRDDEGLLHEHSALCTHLGCVVEWNRAERTWDCPCHGSRFDKCDGHVINGPAASALANVLEGPRCDRPPLEERGDARPHRH